ncbi:hypothetical protein EDC04DRAFT_2608985 [Pisolithus marmoratus]|nr:hypothetical protein EDC04DRAFT_2608985 [Pisolithus marmoratus]
MGAALIPNPLQLSPCYIIQVSNIQESMYTLEMPPLSDSVLYSMQYTAEQGIGTVLVLEYLYFLLQAALDFAIAAYQTSGIRESVCKLINEAIQHHGNDMENLSPIFVQIAKENQMLISDQHEPAVRCSRADGQAMPYYNVGGDNTNSNLQWEQYNVLSPVVGEVANKVISISGLSSHMSVTRCCRDGLYGEAQKMGRGG